MPCSDDIEVEKAIQAAHTAQKSWGEDDCPRESSDPRKGSIHSAARCQHPRVVGELETLANQLC